MRLNCFLSCRLPSIFCVVYCFVLPTIPMIYWEICRLLQCHIPAIASMINKCIEIIAFGYFVCSLIFVVISIYWLVRYLLQCNELAVFFSEWEAYEMWFSPVWKWNKLIFLWTHDIRFSILTKVTWDFKYSSSRKKPRLRNLMADERHFTTFEPKNRNRLSCYL